MFLTHPRKEEEIQKESEFLLRHGINISLNKWSSIFILQDWKILLPFNLLKAFIQKRKLWIGILLSS